VNAEVAEPASISMRRTDEVLCRAAGRYRTGLRSRADSEESLPESWHL